MKENIINLLSTVWQKHWDKILLLVAMFIAYYSMFQFEYFLDNTYGEMFDNTDIKSYIEDKYPNTARIFQAMMFYFWHLYLASDYYNYIATRAIALFSIYALALLLLYMLNKAFKNDRALSLAVLIFLLATPIGSIYAIWLDINALLPGYIIAVATTIVFFQQYMKKETITQKVIVVLLASIPLSIAEFFYQATVTARLAILIVYLLFASELVVFPIKNYVHSAKLSTKLWQYLYKYQLAFVTIFLIGFTQLFYVIIFKISLSYMGLEANGRAGAYLANFYTTFFNIFNKSYTFHYYYFGFFDKSAQRLFGFICIIISFIGAYIEIKRHTKKTKEHEECVIKWLVILMCVVANSFIFMIEPNTKLRTKFMQMIPLFLILMYSLNVLVDFKSLINKLANRLQTPYFVTRNLILTTLTAIVVFISYIYNMQGVVYSNSVEFAYIKSTILTQLKLKPDAKQIYFNIPTPEQEVCYFSPCYNSGFEYGLEFSSHKTWNPPSMVRVTLRMLGLQNSLEVLPITGKKVSTEELRKYDNNDTIIIDVDALNDAFASSYKNKN